MIFKDSSVINEYNEFQMHFEECPYCRFQSHCREGEKIKERMKKESSPPAKPVEFEF